MPGPDKKPNDRNGQFRNGFHEKSRPQRVFGEYPVLSPSGGFSLQTSTNEPEERSSTRWIESESRFLMQDDRVVTRANRGFCTRLVDVLIRSGKARSAVLDFSKNQLSIEFADRATSRSEAARILGDSIRLATMPVGTSGNFDAIPFAQGWDAFAFFRDDRNRATSWWWSETGEDRVRLDGTGLNVRGVDPRVWPDLVPGIRSSRTSRMKHGVTLRIDPDRASLNRIVDSIDELCRILALRDTPGDGEAILSISPVSRLMHLGLATVSMSCAIVGIVIPGVPTVPFVLLTSYHLSKSSDTVHRAFRRTPLFGSLGEDWTNGHFIRSKNKIWLISISTGILMLTLCVSQVSGVTLVTIATIYTLTTASVLAAPGTPRSGEIPQVTLSRNLRMLPA